MNLLQHRNGQASLKTQSMSFEQRACDHISDWLRQQQQ